MGLSLSVRLSGYGMTTLLAIEQHYPDPQRIVTDDLALKMLPGSLRLLARAYRWRGLRNLTIAASDRRQPGIIGNILGRKRYGEERIAEALASGIEQFVFLGAGYDTRGCRLAARQDVTVTVFETDVARNIANKKSTIRSIYGEVPARLVLLPVDFEVDDLGETLSSHGFQPEKPTMFVLEGVLPYLTSSAVHKIFLDLSKAAAGSRFIFSYIVKDFYEGTNLYNSEHVYQRFVVKQLFHFALAPEEIDEFLGKYAWAKREDVGAAEYNRWYLAPANRQQPIAPIERFVHAEKL
jgi:methyltransferase (TIGR00027 family)